jgi:NAD(P)H-flavin reductase
MSQYLDSLKPGDTIDVRGPSGRIKYKRNGNLHHLNCYVLKVTLQLVNKIMKKKIRRF